MSDTVDAARVFTWANSSPRQPANQAFADGPELQAAQWIEWAFAQAARVCEELEAPKVYSAVDRGVWDVATMNCAEAIKTGVKP